MYKEDGDADVVVYITKERKEKKRKDKKRKEQLTKQKRLSTNRFVTILLSNLTAALSSIKKHFNKIFLYVCNASYHYLYAKLLGFVNSINFYELFQGFYLRKIQRFWGH